MSDAIHIGSEVPAGTYRCTNCGYELEMDAGKHLPPCPKCPGPQEWKAITSEADKTPVAQRVDAEMSESSDETSRFTGYDKRLEEWLGSLKDEAGQRSPEVLGGLAAKARDVADYLDKLADRARTKMSPDNLAPSSSEDDSRSDGS
jgi:rubredoxin